MGPRLTLAVRAGPKLVTPRLGAGISELSRALLPTRHGEFEIVAFAGCDGRRLDDFAIVHGDLDAAGAVPVRIHSECVTGDVLGSLRCDCGEQLQRALAQIAASPRGVLVYLRQEGRGIGIANKIAAYALQDEGMDTVEANLHLGFDDDMRNYDTAAGILRALHVPQVELFTNNLRKVEGLVAAGIDVVRRVPLVIPSRPENEHYLATKRSRSGHLLDE
jgi:GTP cyclohydrolase II